MSLLNNRIAGLCDQLKFARLRADWPALAQDAARKVASFAGCLESVLSNELVARYERKRTSLMRLATSPAIKTLERFDWVQAGGKPKAQLQEFALLAFVHHAENVVPLGSRRPDFGRSSVYRNPARVPLLSAKWPWRRHAVELAQGETRSNVHRARD